MAVPAPAALDPEPGYPANGGFWRSSQQQADRSLRSKLVVAAADVLGEGGPALTTRGERLGTNTGPRVAVTYQSESDNDPVPIVLLHIGHIGVAWFPDVEPLSRLLSRCVTVEW